MNNIQSSSKNSPPPDAAISVAAHRELESKLIGLSRRNLTDRQLFDLELIMNGGFFPLTGFLNEDDYRSVVTSMHLKNGALWPMPIVLDLPKNNGLKIGEEVVLCDKYGNPLAVMAIESLYVPNKKEEALCVYGTDDQAHPGVKYLFSETGDVYAGGTVHCIVFSPKYDFKDLRHHPHELKELFQKRGWNKVVAFQTRNPIHRAHFELMKNSAAEVGAHLLIHPVVGLTKEGDIDYITRVRSYKRLHELHAKDFAELSLLPLAMRMAGPREAVWHALIRKNYGCSHFIVGRDHAGPGNDANGKPFYGEYEAQNLAKRHEKEIGLTIVPQREHVYVEELKKYFPKEEVSKSHTVKNISGTEFRRMLMNGEHVPEWFSFPCVIDELRKGVAKANQKGVTVFFTGLPSSGKSTLSQVLHTRLLELQDRPVTLLDGDVVRLNLSRGLGFSKEDRNANIERIGFVASEITKHGGIAICAAIAPFKESRDKNRSLIGKNGTYVEIHVATPLDICKRRDVKGLYKKAEAGEIKCFTGVDDPYEVPENPEIVIDTVNRTPLECVEEAISYLKEKGLITIG